jgi:hypothetical protein
MASIAPAESGGNPDAYNPSGATAYGRSWATRFRATPMTR